MIVVLLVVLAAKCTDECMCCMCGCQEEGSACVAAEDDFDGARRYCCTNAEGEGCGGKPLFRAECGAPTCNEKPTCPEKSADYTPLWGLLLLIVPLIFGFSLAIRMPLDDTRVAATHDPHHLPSLTVDTLTTDSPSVRATMNTIIELQRSLGTVSASSVLLQEQVTAHMPAKVAYLKDHLVHTAAITSDITGIQHDVRHIANTAKRMSDRKAADRSALPLDIVINVSNEINELATCLAGLHKDIRHAEEQHEALTAQLADLKEQSEALDRHQQWLASLDATVQAHRHKAEKLETELATLTKAVGGLREEDAALQSGVFHTEGLVKRLLQQVQAEGDRLQAIVSEACAEARDEECNLAQVMRLSEEAAAQAILVQGKIHTAQLLKTRYEELEVLAARAAKEQESHGNKATLSMKAMQRMEQKLSYTRRRKLEAEDSATSTSARHTASRASLEECSMMLAELIKRHTRLEEQQSKLTVERDSIKHAAQRLLVEALKKKNELSNCINECKSIDKQMAVAVARKEELYEAAAQAKRDARELQSQVDEKSCLLRTLKQDLLQRSKVLGVVTKQTAADLKQREEELAAAVSDYNDASNMLSDVKASIEAAKSAEVLQGSRFKEEMTHLERVNCNTKKEIERLDAAIRRLQPTAPDA